MHVSVLKPEHFDVESHQHPKIMLCSICDLFYPLMTLVLLIQSSYSAPALIQEWIEKKELRSPVWISKLMLNKFFLLLIMDRLNVYLSDISELSQPMDFSFFVCMMLLIISHW